MGVSSATVTAINGQLRQDSVQAKALIDAANRSGFLAGLLDAYVAKQKLLPGPIISQSLIGAKEFAQERDELAIR
jgi:hypothetical protein